MEWRLYPDDAVPHVSTFEFHKDRERARHLEQPNHRLRLIRAASFVFDAAQMIAGYPADRITFSDLGCGDGGLLQLVQPHVSHAWGYDFTPANAEGWAERKVSAYGLDVFGKDRDSVIFGTITAVTEVLEHIADPHGAVAWIADHSKFIVASSPWNESPVMHDECHAWAWDMPGYRAMLENAGWRILRHEQALQFQILLGVKL